MKVYSATRPPRTKWIQRMYQHEHTYSLCQEGNHSYWHVASYWHVVVVASVTATDHYQRFGNWFDQPVKRHTGLPIIGHMICRFCQQKVGICTTMWQTMDLLAGLWTPLCDWPVKQHTRPSRWIKQVQLQEGSVGFDPPKCQRRDHYWIKHRHPIWVQAYIGGEGAAICKTISDTSGTTFNVWNLGILSHL